MTVGILNHAQLERQLMQFAHAQGQAMLGVVSKATAYTLSAPTPKAISILRKRMEEKGCPKGTIDVAFSIAKLIAPRIEEAVKSRSSHEEALAEVTAQIQILKGELSWKDLKATLSGKPTGARAAVQQQPVAEVVQLDPAETVLEVEPLAPIADTLFDRALANMPNWSAQQLGDVFSLLLEICDSDALDAMAEAIVSERLARLEGMQQQAA